MIRFILARTVLLVGGLFLSTVLIFFTLRVLPGDVAQVIAGTEATAAQIQELRDRLGLDDPVIVQYGHWLAGLLRFDLGTSYITGQPVDAEIFAKAQVTVPLGLLSLVIAAALSLTLGYLAAVRHRGPWGSVISFTAQGVASVPTLWAGLLLILLFAIVLRWFPTGGFPRTAWAEPGAALYALLLPALTAGLVEGAILLRYVRSSVLEVLQVDYVRTAAAKGTTRRRALLSDGLPNAGLSLFTLFGMQIATLIVGAIIIENLFQLPGLGRMLVADVGARDFSKVQATIFVMTAFVLVLGALVDIAQRAIDPQQRLRHA
ncbi:ABC transporter permease [Microbacterium saperdae]